MKRIVIAIAASFLSVGAFAGASFAATGTGAQKVLVDQTAVDALANDIAQAIKNLGDSPSVDAVLETIQRKTDGQDLATVNAALEKVANNSGLSPTAKTAVQTAVGFAKTALAQDGKSTGSLNSKTGVFWNPNPNQNQNNNQTGGTGGGGGGYPQSTPATTGT